MKMATKGSDKVFGRCRCCLKTGQHKNIMSRYFRNGVQVVYRDMFQDCFNLFLSTNSNLTNLICTPCIQRLHDALEFKTMVAESEQRLFREIGSNDNVIFVNVPEASVSTDLEIKLEEIDVKQEPRDDTVDDTTYDDGAVDSSALHPVGEVISESDLTEVYSTDQQESQSTTEAANVQIPDLDESIIMEIVEVEDSDSQKGPTHLRALSMTSPVIWSFGEQTVQDDKIAQIQNLYGENLVEGEAELIARFDYVRPLPTRDSLYTMTSNFAKHLDLLKGKVILPETVEKILDAEGLAKTDQIKKNQLSEKSALVTNSAILLENSNLTPFKSKNRSGFPCFYCRHSFESLDKIREHQAKAHKKSELRELLKTSGQESLVVYVDTTDLKCTICNENIANINDLKLHLVKAHKKTIYPGFTDRIIPFRLIENNKFVCQICGFSLETFGSIERHMNTHYRNYICKDCGSGFVTKYRLKVHIKSMHIDGAFPCEVCKKVFASAQKLKNHIDTVHKLIKRFKCPKCNERFSEYFKRQKHMVEKHGVAPLQYKCNVCDKSFDRRYTLSRHMKRDHLEERDFQCDICSYNCFTNNELRVHMIKHNGERIYECAVCKKAYARKKTLREHMRIHNNDRRFSCAVCGLAFVQKCSLKGHIKTHHNEFNPV